MGTFLALLFLFFYERYLLRTVGKPIGIAVNIYASAIDWLSKSQHFVGTEYYSVVVGEDNPVTDG